MSNQVQGVVPKVSDTSWWKFSNKREVRKDLEWWTKWTSQEFNNQVLAKSQDQDEVLLKKKW